MLFLNRHEVNNLLNVGQLVDALAPAMVDLSAGVVSMPPRIGATVNEHDAFLSTMPVYIPSSKILAAKLISVYPDNTKMDLPSHMALVVILDPDTGHPLAIMDGSAITAARTAAGSALATKLLARPEASILVLIGTGVQARAHGLAIPIVRSVKEVRIVGRNREKAILLAEALKAELAVPVHGGMSLESAAKGADIVCAATHSERPVINWESLDPGTHLNSVGYNPKGRELDDDTVMNSLLVVESRSSVLAPSPAGSLDILSPLLDGLITEDNIHAEVGELISGTKEGRTNYKQVTLYKSVGVAVQDGVAARMVFDAALNQGIGTEIYL